MKKNLGYIYNQIKRFMFDIKQGDMILIPSENSSQIAFGLVTDIFSVRDVKKIPYNPQSPKCQFKKYIKVNWQTKIFKDKFDPYLKMLLFTHTTISNINEYKEYINRILYSNYIIGNIVHVTFNVTTTDNINATDLLAFLQLVSNESINVFNEVTGSNILLNTMTLKLNVQSPGPIEFIGYATGGILIAAIINSFLFGIKLNVELLNVIKINIDNPGLIDYLLKFLKERNSNNQKITKLENNLKVSKAKLKLEKSQNKSKNK